MNRIIILLICGLGLSCKPMAQDPPKKPHKTAPLSSSQTTLEPSSTPKLDAGFNQTSGKTPPLDGSTLSSIDESPPTKAAPKKRSAYQMPADLPPLDANCTVNEAFAKETYKKALNKAAQKGCRRDNDCTLVLAYPACPYIACSHMIHRSVHRRNKKAVNILRDKINMEFCGSTTRKKCKKRSANRKVNCSGKPVFTAQCVEGQCQAAEKFLLSLGPTQVDDPKYKKELNQFFVKKRKSTFDRCTQYSPKRFNRVQIEFKVNSQGEASDFKVEDIGNKGLSKCLVRTLKKTTLPKPPKDGLVVKQVFLQK